MRRTASSIGLVGRIAILLLALAVAVPGIVFVSSNDAAAQEVRRGRTLFDMLFNRGPERAQPMEQQVPQRQRVRRQGGGPAASSAAGTPQRVREPDALAKNDDARVLLVIGDFMGGGLGEGLDAAYAQNPNVRVVTRQNGSSGFVRDDYYNWPGEITGILDEVAPAAVAVMLGSNDRQQMSVDGTRESVRTDAWTKEYNRRVQSLAKAIRNRGLPLVWVGLPSFKANNMSTDMIAFNDIYRNIAEEAGGEFVDIWDGFVDENGVFTMVGPDINGQRVRLRGSDGINLTAAGKRKVAFYAERSLNKIFESGNATVSSRGPAGEAPDTGPAQPLAPAQIVRTQPISLSDPALDGASSLMGASPSARQPSDPIEALSAAGADSAPRAGRADDFAMRPASAPDRSQSTAAIPQ